jgi:hypothetical protein
MYDARKWVNGREGSDPEGSQLRKQLPGMGRGVRRVRNGTAISSTGQKGAVVLAMFGGQWRSDEKRHAVCVLSVASIDQGKELSGMGFFLAISVKS